MTMTLTWRKSGKAWLHKVCERVSKVTAQTSEPEWQIADCCVFFVFFLFLLVRILCLFHVRFFYIKDINRINPELSKQASSRQPLFM